jgi:hypothetical protein
MSYVRDFASVFMTENKADQNLKKMEHFDTNLIFCDEATFQDCATLKQTELACVE